MGTINRRQEQFWQELAKQHHKDMVEKGFHEAYSHEDILMRAAAEVGEASAAFRKNRRADMDNFDSKTVSELGNSPYDKYIKGTLEEELSDIVLIMMDFMETNGLKLCLKGEMPIATPTGKFLSIVRAVGNIAGTLDNYGIESDFGHSMVPNYTNTIFILTLSLAKDLKINIKEQVKLKMIYNKSRPYKHGDIN